MELKSIVLFAFSALAVEALPIALEKRGIVNVAINSVLDAILSWVKGKLTG